MTKLIWKESNGKLKMKFYLRAAQTRGRENLLFKVSKVKWLGQKEIQTPKVLMLKMGKN